MLEKTLKELMENSVLGSEEIEIEMNGHTVRKEFVPLEILDFPVEYVSTDGSLYLLLLIDDEGGDWWYVAKTDPKTMNEYLIGEISIRDIFNRGQVYVGFRNYKEEDNVIKGLEPLEKKLQEGFISEDELPYAKF